MKMEKFIIKPKQMIPSSIKIKGITKLESQMYTTKKGRWNFRIVAFSNLFPKGLFLSGSTQGFENKKQCKEEASAWTYKGMTPTLVELKKYYRLS